MSKTYKDVKKLDNATARKPSHEAVQRFKREKAKADTRLFKRDVQFTSWLDKTAQD